MSAALARIKVRGVRAAIAASGGVDGAGATAERSRSVAGDWNNINHPAFPPLDCAFALDEVALAVTGAAPVLQALAAELGHVAFRLPEAVGDHEAVALGLIEAAAEFGDIAHVITNALRDKVICPRERNEAIGQIDEAQASLARLRALLDGGAASVAVLHDRAGSAR